MLLTKPIKPISMICSWCFKPQTKVAYFPKYESLFCKDCWKERFNNLTINEKKEWMFYEIHR